MSAHCLLIRKNIVKNLLRLLKYALKNLKQLKLVVNSFNLLRPATGLWDAGGWYGWHPEEQKIINNNCPQTAENIIGLEKNSTIIIII